MAAFLSQNFLCRTRGGHLADAFRAVNPYCTVPVLELGDGTRLTSTQGCWRYLEETHPEPALLGTTAAEKALIADRVWRIENDGWQAATVGGTDGDGYSGAHAPDSYRPPDKKIPKQTLPLDENH